jgi:hypothetical protein
MTLVLGLFLILHGLVHLLYLGQSARLFELRSGMVWPDHSWAFAWLASPESEHRRAHQRGSRPAPRRMRHQRREGALLGKPIPSQSQEEE